MSDFVKIDRSEVPGKKSPSGRGPGARTRALIDGDTIWVPGNPQWVAGSFHTLRRRGLRARTRQMVRDGVVGTAVWVEKIDRAEL